VLVRAPSCVVEKLVNCRGGEPAKLCRGQGADLTGTPALQLEVKTAIAQVQSAKHGGRWEVRGLRCCRAA
jgi:hypothetical protein